MVKKNLGALFACWLLAFLPTDLLAQTTAVDVIVMKDGRQLKGEILNYLPGHSLTLREADGQTIEILDADISKILQGVEERKPGKAAAEKPRPTTPAQAKTDGIYNTSSLSFAMGQGSGDGLSLGAGFSNVVGYQMSAPLGLGVGFGIDNYARRGETVYPVFAEFRSFLPSKNKGGNYYFLLDFGYGFAFERSNIDITGAKGGLMYSGAIGYRAATQEGLDVNVDVGVKFQEAEFERTLFNGDVEIRSLVYQRFVVRVGLTLWKK